MKMLSGYIAAWDTTARPARARITIEVNVVPSAPGIDGVELNNPCVLIVGTSIDLDTYTSDELLAEVRRRMDVARGAKTR